MATTTGTTSIDTDLKEAGRAVVQREGIAVAETVNENTAAKKKPNTNTKNKKSKDTLKTTVLCKLRRQNQRMRISNTRSQSQLIFT